jgi:Raf kinase inhibitor-like YbhB/YbcL family protein
MQVTSPAFDDGKTIPQRYAVEGQNVSPVLEWRAAPPQTKSFAVICEDPDAPSGTFHHWAVWNIPADRNRLEEGEHGLPQALNDFGKRGWGGPMPPKGDPPHHYHFRVLALDRERLDLPDRARVTDVEAAARDWVLDEAELVGLYKR